ncbi:butyrophilin subfamily 3 member A1-like isoform X2 [Polypterus senegalus]|uniref:butyrophilin subfamily 3 member A1-like isoform X2 n=1 Tax=Polypterus senegalus TaxID=55291 RepID=UPI0019643DF9|nr:butyrophilin subfamily 3 member A1-like isoform X2 [Polypterus senegalus]
MYRSLSMCGCIPKMKILTIQHSIIAGFLVHLFICACWTDAFEITIPQATVSSSIGHSVVLPCHLSQPDDFKQMEVRWHEVKDGIPVIIYYRGNLANSATSPVYKGRVRLFLEKVSEGNLSLELTNVKFSDMKKYRCSVISSDLKYTAGVTELQVTATGSKPVISLRQTEPEGAQLTCETSGWYPEPKLMWQDVNSEDLTANSETSAKRDSGDLFTVTSHLRLADRSSEGISCIVKLDEGLEEKKTIYKEKDQYLDYKLLLLILAGAILLVAFLCVIFMKYRSKGNQNTIKEQKASKTPKKTTNVLFSDAEDDEKEYIQNKGYKPQTKKRQTEEKLNVSTKSSFRKAHDSENDNGDKIYSEDEDESSSEVSQSQRLKKGFLLSLSETMISFFGFQHVEADVLFDTETAHPMIEVSDNGKEAYIGHGNDTGDGNHFNRLFCILGKDGFSSGKHYWDVMVKNKKSWDLGVATEGAERQGRPHLIPENGYWIISLRNTEDLIAQTNPPKTLIIEEQPKKVRVSIDYKKGEISFTDANSGFCFHTFSDIVFKDKLYPFFSPCGYDNICYSKEPMIICSP